jgi:hypothetical protein
MMPVVDFFSWFVPDFFKDLLKDIWYGKDTRSAEEIERLWEEATSVFDDIDGENAEDIEDKAENNVAEDEWEFEEDED